MRRLVLLALLSSTALAAPAAPKLVEKYTIRVKTQSASGAVTFVPIGEVTRVNGAITAKGLAAPALDKLADTLDAQWKAYKWPASITITETLPSNSMMGHGYAKHSATFTPKDALYTSAIVHEFTRQYGYTMLGLSSIKFITYDSSAGPPGPPVAMYDGGSTYSNFRKNTVGPDYSNGSESVFLSIRVRKTARPEEGARVSATDPKLVVPRHNDDGTFEVGWLNMTADGKIALNVRHARDVFDHEFGMGAFTPEDRDVQMYVHGEYKPLHVAKTSPYALEAWLVDVEEGQLVDIVPAIDPALFR